MRRPYKIAVAGAHSTGKTTFLDRIETNLSQGGVKVGRVADLATAARELGFPILTGHTIESTLWIMAKGMQLEAEASLLSDVILVDRPTLDAFGYLEAALKVSGRVLPQFRVARLRMLATSYVGEYDLLIATSIDPEIELGQGRDGNALFREAASACIDELVHACRPDALRLTSKNSEEVAVFVDAEARRFLAERDSDAKE